MEERVFSKSNNRNTRSDVAFERITFAEFYRRFSFKKAFAVPGIFNWDHVTPERRDPAHPHHNMCWKNTRILNALVCFSVFAAFFIFVVSLPR